MNNAAVLIAAIAGLIGSLTSFVGMIVVVRRTSPRERKDAAESAAEKVMLPNPPLFDIAKVLGDVTEIERGENAESGNKASNKRRRRRRAR